MTLKIEKESGPLGTTIRLIGRMQAEHILELKSQIEQSKPEVTLNLEQMSLVDFEAIHFLAACQTGEVKIVGASQYVRDWIESEPDFGR